MTVVTQYPLHIWCAIFCHLKPAIVHCLWSKHRMQLSQQMRARKGDIEVQLLLYAIQKTTNFEKALAQKYSTTPYIEKVKYHLYSTLYAHTYMYNACLTVPRCMGILGVCRLMSLLCSVPNKYVCFCVIVYFVHTLLVPLLVSSAAVAVLCSFTTCPPHTADHSSPSTKEVFLGYRGSGGAYGGIYPQYCAGTRHYTMHLASPSLHTLCTYHTAKSHGSFCTLA